MENNLYSKRDVKEMLRSRDLHFKKSLGQNFLTDESVLSDIVDAAQITKNDYVLEIGPGPGVLTRQLAKNAARVVAVELDREIIELLCENISDYKNVEIINNDILKIDLEELSREHFDSKPFKVIANLPYYITTPIVMKLLESKADIESIVIMIQKEVADRLTAKPGTKDFGAISLSVNYYADAKIVRLVPPEAFVPAPKVFSAVLKLSVLKEPRVSVRDEAFLFKLIKASFSKRRKTFLNAISGESGISVTKEEAKQALFELGFSDNLRGETLSLVEFAQISDFFLKKICEKNR
ncbi:MAG: 16S rRNA (adenine(1518)-N(6)/adenine(1519)-N(6))-dimethyltransferase RsmA [Ruminococcaceae bacterium]|nr:16S rRNA (adenine(1518)-N(6)/adenine(1519)-N(6))-dimethyltransferase RsmA [Oscillospiraceae bacterium]